MYLEVLQTLANLALALALALPKLKAGNVHVISVSPMI